MKRYDENEWRVYKRIGSIEARVATADDYLNPCISVSPADRESGYRGGMVACNPDNRGDQWFIAQAFFDKHYQVHE